MENCEAMTSSTHLFAYSHRMFKKHCVENYEIANVISDLQQNCTVLFEIFVYSFYRTNEAGLDFLRNRFMIIFMLYV